MLTRSPSRRRRRRLLIVTAVCAFVATGCLVPFDFDGNGKADIASIDDDGSWYRAGEATPFFESAHPALFDLGVAGDYDGDGQWEAANLLTDGRWETAGARGTFTFDHPPVGPQFWQRPVPVPGNYDDDRATEPAWYLPDQATWIIEGKAPIEFGVESDAAYSDCEEWDVPVPADYDGDGQDDVAVYRPTDGTVHQHGVGEIAQLLPFGFPAPADYDGDGVDDPAVVGPVPVDVSEPDPYDWVWDLELHIAGQDPMAVDWATFGVPAPANYHGAPGDEFAVWWENDESLRVEGMAPVTLTSGWTPSTVRPWLWMELLRLTFIQNTYMVDEHCAASS